MNNNLFRKLDALSRTQIEEGLPEGVDITLCLSHIDMTEVLKIGFKVYSQIDNIVTGYVDSELQLNELADLLCVEEIQFTRPLYLELRRRERGSKKE